jgi:thiol-disulfide isomerase/thioredoxin
MDVTALFGPAIAAVTVLAATVAGLWWRCRTGRIRPVPDAAATDRGAVLASLGVAPGAAAVTLLQFSSAFCAPCRATRVTCAQVTAHHRGVRHVEIDAEGSLDAVRALGVWRTPTVFVVDISGRIVTRISGAPTRAQVIEAVQPLLPEASPAMGAS